jgi:hypothetical protein
VVELDQCGMILAEAELEDINLEVFQYLEILHIQ